MEEIKQRQGDGVTEGRAGAAASGGWSRTVSLSRWHKSLDLNFKMVIQRGFQAEGTPWGGWGGGVGLARDENGDSYEDAHDVGLDNDPGP